MQTVCYSGHTVKAGNWNGNGRFPINDAEGSDSRFARAREEFVPKMKESCKNFNSFQMILTKSMVGLL